MTIIYLSLLAMVLLVAVPVSFSRMTQKYTDEIRRRESQISMLTVKVEDQEAEVARLAAEEDELRQRRVALMEAEQALPSLGSAPEPVEAPSTPESYLLAAGLISKKDLEKAKSYKSGSSSAYELGDILVMMDVIDASDWAFAKAKAAAKKGDAAKAGD